MSTAYIVVALVGAVAVLAAFWWGFYPAKLKKNPSPLMSSLKEPSFDNTVAVTTTTTTATDTTAASPDNAPSRIEQGVLRISRFEPPDLPSPIESAPVLEMCYVMHFYGDTPRRSADFEPLRESVLPKNALRELFLAYDGKAKKWRIPTDEKFTHWLLAVPLANRNGALNAEKIKSLEEESRRFAEKRSLRAVFPSALETVKNAGLLDKFCNTADIVVELWLSGQKIKAAEVAAVANMHGLVEDGEKEISYVLRVDSETLFLVRLMTVGGMSEVMRIVFELDAPNVSNPVAAFDRMSRCLERMAAVWQMSISDPRGEAVDAERLKTMREQLIVLERQMSDFGVPPGGAVAHLLFT